MKSPRWTTTQVYPFRQAEMDDDQAETVQNHQALCDCMYLKWEWTKVGSWFSLWGFLLQVLKKTQKVKTYGQNRNKCCHAKQMVTQAPLFHYFPSDCRCHSYRDLKTEYGAVKMVLYRAKIPDRHSCSVWSGAESWVWNPQQYLQKPVM